MTIIDIREWESIAPSSHPALRNQYFPDSPTVRQQLDVLRGKINITELRNGIAIETTSFVGRVRIGDFIITVRPKIASETIVDLVKYAYNLRNIRSFDVVEHATTYTVFQDLLIYQLILEAKELVNRGLHRQYQREMDSLASPRGRIDIQRIVKNGNVVDGRIPCIYFPRTTDMIFNQIILSGLQFASSLTDDLELRATARRMAALFEDMATPVWLTAQVLKSALREVSRLTKSYEPAFLLIALLLEGKGISLSEEDADSSPIPGFLFDMNHLWETVLSRFLSENLEKYEVRDQHPLRNLLTYSPNFNPQRRYSPTPRPDFVIFESGKVVTMADAKYRDIWSNGLPPAMLYQLAIYALSQGFSGSSVILYPTLDNAAVTEVIEIKNTQYVGTTASVALRPVNVIKLSQVIRSSGLQGKREAQSFARNCVFPLHPQRIQS
jgi:5-methylcytosine-specific restriction enzyme subunit McrC